MTDQATERAQRLATLPFESSGPTSVRSVGGFVSAVREIFGQKELLDLLIRRELKSRYKDSSLGFVWSLIRPLTMLLIYYVFIGQVLGAARGVPDFAIFVYAGLTLWGLYSEIVTAGTSSIITNAGLIKKVYLPREIFPLASVGSALFNFAIQMGILLLATIALGQFPLSWDLLYVPVAVIIVIIYGTALALLLSALNVYLRDVQYLVEVAILLFFWASPIVYSWSFVVNATVQRGASWLGELYLLNPISISMIAFDRGIWKAGSEQRVIEGNVIPAQPWPEHMDIRLVITAIVGLVFVVIAQRIFARLQGNFAQEI
ncbi:MAG: ABC transporter permease [Herbiconiux sp.]|nr:MAG: ABC transporter permease [Herbiconiux sp.]